jgi:CHASE2 domain-containing sensor protein
MKNVFSGNAQVVVQARTIVGHLVFRGSGANAWPAMAAYAVALALSVTTGLLGWRVLDRLGSQKSPVLTAGRGCPAPPGRCRLPAPLW